MKDTKWIGESKGDLYGEIVLLMQIADEAYGDLTRATADLTSIDARLNAIADGMIRVDDPPGESFRALDKKRHILEALASADHRYDCAKRRLEVARDCYATMVMMEWRA